MKMHSPSHVEANTEQETNAAEAKCWLVSFYRQSMRNDSENIPANLKHSNSTVTSCQDDWPQLMQSNANLKWVNHKSILMTCWWLIPDKHYKIIPMALKGRYMYYVCWYSFCHCIIPLQSTRATQMRPNMYICMNVLYWFALRTESRVRWTICIVNCM